MRYTERDTLIGWHHFLVGGSEEAGALKREAKISRIAARTGWMDGDGSTGFPLELFFLFSISQLLNSFIVWSVCAFCQCHSGIWQEAQLYPFFVFFFFLSVVILLSIF